MAVNIYAATSLAKVMGHSLLAYLTHRPGGRPTGDALDSHRMESSIHGLGNDIQTILRDALAEATTMFPHKTPATPSQGKLPRHLWPKTVRHDISNLRRRAKVIHHLIKYETKNRRALATPRGPLPTPMG